jgi:hypothetical protein
MSGNDFDYLKDKRLKPPKTPPASRLPAPVDHEVRPMPKPPMPAREREIRDECRLLSEIDWDKIADRLVAMYRNDRHGTTIPDGRPTKTLNTEIPAADPEALTSTEAAVNARVFAGTGDKRTGDKTGKLERDPLHEAFVRARAALGQMALAINPLLDNLNAAKEAQTYVKPVGQTSTPCKVEGCDSPAVKRGYCDTDNRAALRWEAEHNEPIPPAKLEENARNRQPQKRRQPA